MARSEGGKDGLTTTLPENVAWSTGADWPEDGETATIESIGGQVQELKDRSNYLKNDSAQGTTALKTKTDQLGLQCVEAEQRFNSANLNTNFNGATPKSIVGSFLHPTIALLAGDIIEFEFGMIILDNTTPVVDADLLVLYSENNGTAATIHDYPIPATTKWGPLTIVGQHTMIVPGFVNIYLAGVTAGVSDANVSSIETNHFIGRWRVMRPVT